MSTAWMDTFRRESGVKRALIIDGNISDIFFNPSTEKYLPFVDILPDLLKKKGFANVFVWDRQSGIVNPDQALEDLRKKAVSEKSGKRPEGDDYDLGSGAPSPQSTQNSGPPSPDDFFALVLHSLTRPSSEPSSAFIIDWSNLLFGNANSLSEQERNWLLLLSKAVRNAPERNLLNEISKPGSLIVLLCGSNGTIPSVFHHGNPMVRQISIPIPSRKEREEFLTRMIDRFAFSKSIRPGESAFNDFIDALEGMTLRDIMQIASLSHQVETVLPPEGLINLHKYGEKSSPWEELNRSKLQKISEILRTSVKGQDYAIEKVDRVIIRAYTGLSGIQHSRKQRTPKGILFFVGPTGVGKTELAKSLARFLFGDEDSFLRFDMSEYNHEHGDQRLVGAPPGYVGYEEGGQLTNAVKRRPFSVILFDEIEKAHPKILDKFLQILEDGRLTDGKGETVYFSESVIIFTSNIGAAEVPTGGTDEETREAFKQKVREHFVHQLKRPELLNRIGDNIVPFSFISNNKFLIEIARSKLVPIREFLKEKYRITDLAFKDEDKALSAIVSTLDRSNGGRGVLNELQSRIVDPLANFIFTEEENTTAYAGRTIRVILVGEKNPSFQFTLE